MKQRDKENVVVLPGNAPASPTPIIESLRSALSMATDAEFEHVEIVLRMREKAYVIIRSGED